MGAMPLNEKPSGIMEQIIPGDGKSTVKTAISAKAGAAARQSQWLRFMAKPRRSTPALLRLGDKPIAISKSALRIVVPFPDHARTAVAADVAAAGYSSWRRHQMPFSSLRPLG